MDNSHLTLTPNGKSQLANIEPAVELWPISREFSYSSHPILFHFQPFLWPIRSASKREIEWVLVQ